MKYMMDYLEESIFAVEKIDEGIYRVIKDTYSVYGIGHYLPVVSLTYDLNKVSKVAIYDTNRVFLHANFELGDEK